MKIGFIGLGLIGGSIAKGIKRVHPDYTLLAYSRTRSKLEMALDDGSIDEIIDTIDGRLGSCDVLIFCTPVSYIADYLEKVKPFLSPSCILTDVGSTKQIILREIERLGLTSQFVGGHPMAGSEKTGYESSSDHLLENAYYIITPTEKTPASHVERMTEIANIIGAIPTVLDYRHHDFIVAAISHLPHLIASSLVNLVRDCDGEDQMMKKLAAGGFKDITRIASSSPVMWEQICMTNEENISVVMEKYIASLNTILAQLKSREAGAVHRLFETSRDYRNSFAEMTKGPIAPDYAFSVDVVDEPGAISIISAILAGRGISIKNIGINHNREHGEGALCVSFYDEESMRAAWDRLLSYNYTLFPG